MLFHDRAELETAMLWPVVTWRFHQNHRGLAILPGVASLGAKARRGCDGHIRQSGCSIDQVHPLLITDLALRWLGCLLSHCPIKCLLAICRWEASFRSPSAAFYLFPLYSHAVERTAFARQS